MSYALHAEGEFPDSQGRLRDLNWAMVLRSLEPPRVGGARHRLLGALLLVLTAACTRWEPSTIRPRQLLAEEHPGVVRVTRADGESMVLRSPRIEGDYISSCAREASDRCAAALDDVLQVEVQRYRPVATVVLGLTVVWLVISSAGS
jgi:hypothetical protein